MESVEKLFNTGKFLECSLALGRLLNPEDSTPEESLDVRFLYYFQHNKIVAEALNCDWFDEEINDTILHQEWCKTFTSLTNLCDKLRCDLLTSNFGHEVLLVATLNLLSWSWESLGDYLDGYLDQVNRLAMYSLQTELSSCGESALEHENILALSELFKKLMWRIPTHRCHVLLDTVCLYFLHMLRFENCEQELMRCLKILQGFFEILPEIYIHLTLRTPAEKSPSLFLLGPSIASSTNDPNLSVNLLVIATVLYLLKLNQCDKAWHVLEKNSCAKSEKLEGMLEYLKAVVCLRRNDFDRAMYHVKLMCTMPMEAHMIKRKTILLGHLHILKGNYDTALQCFRDNSGLPEDEDQLPIHVYLMAHSYGLLNQPEQQLVLLDCVADVLREDPHYCSGRLTPVSSLEDRLLRCLHRQPELSLFQTLLAMAEASMKSSQPGNASEYLLEALQQTKGCPDFQEKPNDFLKVRSFQSVMKDTVVSLLKIGDISKARILCSGLMELPVSEQGTFLNQAITRLLLSDVLPDKPADKKQSILLEAVKLLKKQKEVSSGERNGTSHDRLINMLMARAFYRKAKLYASRCYNEDATTYFKRALALREGDTVVLREYQRHLFIIGETDEAQSLLKKIRDNPTSSQQIDDLSSEGFITMNYLINAKVEDRS